MSKYDLNRYWQERHDKLADENTALKARVAELEGAHTKLRGTLEFADGIVCEEVNYSNYDHGTICRIGAMWDEAHGAIQQTLKEVPLLANPEDK